VAFWPLPPVEPRIQFVRAFQFSEDLSGDQSSRFEDLVFGEVDRSDTAIEKPYGIDMRDGRIYVCDIRYPALTVLDLQNQQMRRIGTTGINRTTHPVDVSVADDGWIYVADNGRNTVLVYDPDERYARTIGSPGMRPVSLATHGNRLYVCDLQAQHVVILDRHSGEKIGEFGEVGDEDGQFRVPLAVETDEDGYVYVTDMMRCRVQKFSSDGEFIAGMGELGDYAGSFARPKQLAVDADGVVYVVDAAFQNVQMFNEDFELLMEFGAAGEHPGAMNLPAGICVSDERLDLTSGWVHEGFEPLRYVVVTNQFGANKVNLYVLGRLRDGWAVADLAPSAINVSQGVGQNQEGAGLSETIGTPPGDEEQAPTDESTGAEPPGGGGLE
jgi:DNA-binding beta-propeller fold protein YncE